MNPRRFAAVRGVVLSMGLVVAGGAVASGEAERGVGDGFPSFAIVPQPEVRDAVPDGMRGGLPLKLGPEAVLDLMYSSFNPLFQPALLSRPSQSAKPITAIEDMRQNEYVRHAIAEVMAPLAWVKATVDGRILPACPLPGSAGLSRDWKRLPPPLPESIGLARRF